MSKVTKINVEEYFANNPRMMGVAFALGLFTFEAVGSVKAVGAITRGP